MRFHSRSRLRSRLALPAALTFVGVLVAARPAAAQSYGLGDQVRTLGSMEFRTHTNTGVYALNFDDGYIYGSPTDLLAPLVLPDGAEIFQMCVYANIPDDTSLVQIQLYAWKLPPGGLSPGRYGVPGAGATENVPIGYGVVCTDTFSYTFHDTADVDGDQNPEHVFHGVNAIVVGNAGLGGVRVAWRRQVSPPPGSPTFNDVPASDGAFQFVEALFASGITAGCGVGIYCPDAPLTRRQMAVFLSKALGLHWPL